MADENAPYGKSVCVSLNGDHAFMQLMLIESMCVVRQPG